MRMPVTPPAPAQVGAASTRDWGRTRAILLDEGFILRDDGLRAAARTLAHRQSR